MDAITSGVIGAFTAFLGKLTFDVNSPLLSYITSTCDTEDCTEEGHKDKIVWGVRVVGGAAMVAFNGIAIYKFVDSMKVNGSAQGVAISAASNYVAASFIGWGVLGERKSGMWFVGLGLILVGTYLLATVRVVKKDVVAEKSKNT